MSSDPFKVLFFGDSTCVGQGVSIYDGWVTKIARGFKGVKSRDGRDVCVINSSVNGRTSRQALEDMPYHIQTQKAEVVIVQFGLNDCNHWDTDHGLPRVSLDAFTANMKEIVERLMHFSSESIFINTNHPTSRNHKKFLNASLTFEDANKKYNQALRREFQSFHENVELIDIEKYFESEVSSKNLNEFLLSDGLHLSELGHQLYFDATFEIIARSVKS